MMIGRLNHIAIVVPDLDSAAAVYRDALGARVSPPQSLTAHGVTVVFVELPNTKIELLQPLGPETAVGKFLSRRGPGLHHVAYRVASVQAALDACAAAGMRLIDEAPRTGIRGSRVAFLHPASTGGVLTEIVQPAEEHHP